METWIAFLRGVNVGGKNKLPMKELVAALEASGIPGAKTYIQSGNIVINCSEARSANLRGKLAAVIKDRFGFEPGVVILSAGQLARARDANPFASEVGINGKSIHFYFMSDPPLELDKDRLESLRRPTERWQFYNSVFYLYTPEGIGDSKLARQVEKALPKATARNLNTVEAVLALATELIR